MQPGGLWSKNFIWINLCVIFASFAVSAFVTWLGLPICLKTYRKK